MRNVIAFIFLSIILSGCNVDLPVIYGKVCGTVTNSLSKEPAQDVLVYLLDRSLEEESQLSEKPDAKLDSTITDLNGQYCFDSLAKGSYTVVPFSKSMEIKHVDSTSNYNFEVVDGESYNVDFEVRPVVSYSSFTTQVDFINVPKDESIQYLDCSVNRRSWILWFEYSQMIMHENVYPNAAGDYSFAFYEQYGGSTGLYTLDNVFHVNALKTDVNGKKLGYYSFELYTPIVDTPEYVLWEFDCSTEILTRIQ